MDVKDVIKLIREDISFFVSVNGHAEKLMGGNFTFYRNQDLLTQVISIDSLAFILAEKAESIKSWENQKMEYFNLLSRIVTLLEAGK